MSTNTIYGAKTQAKHLTCTGASATWTSNNPSYAITWSRTDFTKRPKPVYPDILFSPTSYSHSRGAKRDAFMWYWVKCSSGIFKGQMRPLPTTVNDYHGLAIPNVVLTPNTALLTNRLLAKIKDQRVNFAMSLAQARETASLFNDIAEKIRDALACKRRLLKGKKCRSGDYPPWLKRRSGEFLAASYGIMPLVNDMIGSLELLDGSLMDKSVVRSFTTTQKVEMEVKDVVGSNRDKVVHAFTKHKMSAKAKAYVEWDKEGLATASSLGLTNPAFVIWDMIPYSHVIDWGIGVGNYLNNLDALAGVKRVSAHYTVKNHAYREILSVWGGKGTGYRMVTSRSILNITAPRLTVGPGVNAFRGLQALAMARQLL